MIVGESGCGKTTIMQLIERFYDIDEGEILIDGINIKDYNLRSLRKNIGYIFIFKLILVMLAKNQCYLQQQFVRICFMEMKQQLKKK